MDCSAVRLLVAAAVDGHCCLRYNSVVVVVAVHRTADHSKPAAAHLLAGRIAAVAAAAAGYSVVVHRTVAHLAAVDRTNNRY